MAISEIKVVLENDEEATLVKSLLETLTNRDAEIRRLNTELSNMTQAESLASMFLVNEVPETASDFAKYLLKNANNRFGEDIDVLIYALTYHHETLENDDVDNVIAELERIKAEVKK